MTPACIVMGVSGAGKSTIGAALAARIGAEFIEGDALHPAENRRKMTAGAPLSDEDRLPWLGKVAAAIRECGARDVIVACSALKRRYRDLIRSEAGRPLIFVYLAGEEALLRSRLEERAGHFMPASLLASQIATLEPPAEDESRVIVNSAQPIEAIVDDLVIALRDFGVFCSG